MTEVNQYGFDLAKIRLNQGVALLVKAMACVKLQAAGRDLSSDAELLAHAAQVADDFMPAIMSRYWSEVDAHKKREVAKDGWPAGASVDVHIYPEQVESYLTEHLDVVIKGDRASMTFDGDPLKPLKHTVKGDGPSPTVQVDVHVPPAQVDVHNHIPQQAAPVVHVHPTTVVQAPTAPTTSRIEYGPDGKPKAIHRTAV
jgi:hypothetical protein